MTIKQFRTISLLGFFSYCLFFNLLVFAKTKPAIQKGSVYHTVENIKNYWVSEKLDGVRGYWNGKLLLTRQGNNINAPKWFTQNWPNTLMDGELWIARGQFEQTSGIIRQKSAAKSSWQKIRFMIFDLPKTSGNFSQRIAVMKNIIKQANSPYLNMITQQKFSSVSSLFAHLDGIVELGGEGLMLHHQNALYKVGRVQHLMKLKKYQDAEAKVIAHIQGKGKFINMLGAIKVKTKSGIVFKIGSGFSNEERKNPPPIGTQITYKFFGKTKNGIPRFVSFMRIRHDV